MGGTESLAEGQGLANPWILRDSRFQERRCLRQVSRAEGTVATHLPEARLCHLLYHCGGSGPVTQRAPPLLRPWPLLTLISHGKEPFSEPGEPWALGRGAGAPFRVSSLWHRGQGGTENASFVKARAVSGQGGQGRAEPSSLPSGSISDLTPRHRQSLSVVHGQERLGET